MKRTALPLLAALLLGLLSACGSDVERADDGSLVLGQAEVQETVTRGVTPDSRELVLTGFSGNIHLTAGEGREAQLEFVKRARGDDQEDAAGLLNSVLIEEAGDGDAYRYTMRSEEPARTSVDVYGTIPRDARLRIEMQSGDIEVSGAGGPLVIHNGSGDAHVGGAASTVEVVTGNGNVDVGFRTIPADATIRIESSNGNVGVTMPASTGARVKASTGSGDIRVGEGLDFSNRRLRPSASGSEFEGQMGRGSASIQLSTNNGDVTMNEGIVERLASSEMSRQSPVPATGVGGPAPVPVTP